MRKLLKIAKSNNGCPVLEKPDIMPPRRIGHVKRLQDLNPPGPAGIGVIDCCILKPEERTLVQRKAPAGAPRCVVPCNY